MKEHKATLTKRHEQLLKHIANGGSSKDFAEKYKLSPKTVSTHRLAMMKEIDCHSVSEVTRYAIKFGYIDLGPLPEPFRIS